jgi:hypothetical protein
VADHTRAKLDTIPESAINQAKQNLHIAYGHTSHGSQIITGMSALIGKTNLVGYKGDIYQWNEGGSNGALDIDDYFASGDLGHYGDTTWAQNTRIYLNDDANADVNVIIWSWCGGVSDNTEAGINIYLNKMNELESNYPDIKFVYMTGHLDGSGTEGNLHIRNEQIRIFCNENDKILYDFADIESYDPDGNYFLDKDANDNCNFDGDANGSLESNWAVAWQTSHTENTDWYYCEPAHSQALNGNLKAYAAWWLWARIAGWEDETTYISDLKNNSNRVVNLYCFPNPVEQNIKLVFELSEPSITSIKIFNQHGAEISKTILGKLPLGINSYDLNTECFASGIYYYQICTNSQKITKKLIVH